MLSSIRFSLRSSSKTQCVTSAASARWNSTMAVTSAMVKELREKSGAPMMDCKKALSDATVCGDIEKGMNWLRMKGIARASQSERASQEGLIAFLHTPTVCTLVEVNSETDFVGKNVKFHSFVSMLANVCNKLPTEGAIDIKELLTKSVSVDKDSASIETIADALGDIVSQIRENIVIRRAINLPIVQATEHSSQSIIAGYVHGRVGIDHLPENIMMGKTAAVVKLQVAMTGDKKEIDKDGKGDGDVGSIQDIGRKLAMHVVAAHPFFLSRADVPEHTINTEIEIFKQQSKEASDAKMALGGKYKEPTQQMMDKIIEGKVKKRLSDICLLSQPHVAEEGSPVVEDFINQAGATLGGKITISHFERWNLGQTEKPPTTTEQK